MLLNKSVKFAISYSGKTNRWLTLHSSGGEQFLSLTVAVFTRTFVTPITHIFLITTVKIRAIQGCYGDYSSWQHRDMFCNMIGRPCAPCTGPGWSRLGGGLTRTLESFVADQQMITCDASNESECCAGAFLQWRGSILDLVVGVVNFLLVLGGASTSCAHDAAVQ